MTDIFAARTYPEIPAGQMCDECGSLQYHATYCKVAPPVIRAGVRAAFDVLDFELWRVGAMDDDAVKRAREQLGKAVGAAAGFFEQAVEQLRGAAQKGTPPHD